MVVDETFLPSDDDDDDDDNDNYYYDDDNDDDDDDDNGDDDNELGSTFRATIEESNRAWRKRKARLATSIIPVHR
ncbi:hypothetical protein M0804_010678 [Polistes exclamans]|nr:hypothetical protein M0804_010678 [Polistes exclamans]